VNGAAGWEDNRVAVDRNYLRLASPTWEGSGPAPPKKKPDADN
jgi:hypothetical protein